MIRMLLIGYCLGIRSERRLCEEVHLNLAYRWFCRLGLEGAVPDHSTFSKNRHGRFRDSDLLRKLFEMTVERCMAEGLVGAEGFAVDASLIRADVHRQRSVPGEEGLPPEAAGRAVREYLEVLDDAVFGGATLVSPKRINLTDPAARWTAATREAAFYSYSTNYLIDLDHAVIVDVEATTSVRQVEVTAQRRMIERTQERFGLWPEKLVADTAYGPAPNLAWLVEDQGIERRQRKKVEMLFAHLKRIPKLDRLRLRGPNGAKDEFHLAAAAQKPSEIGQDAADLRTPTGLSGMADPLTRSPAIRNSPPPALATPSSTEQAQKRTRCFWNKSQG